MWHEYFFQKMKEALPLQLRDNFICTLSVLIILLWRKKRKMVNFKLSETNVKMIWSTRHECWESCWELRYFLCPTLVTCWSYRFHICFTELKIYHLLFLRHHATSLILAVCRTHVKYEPSTWPCSPWVLRSWGAPAWDLGGHRFESCLGFRFFPCPMLLTCWSCHFHNYYYYVAVHFYIFNICFLMVKS